MTIFVGGVHAVGKTFLLKFACDELGLRHATASELIKEQRGQVNWTISRQVDNIDENQRDLVTAVKNFENGHKTLVLDGHFILRRGVAIHEKISIQVFDQLKITGAILIEAPAAVIFERLRQRGDTTWDKSEIESFSTKEREYAADVCKNLSIPLVKLYSPSILQIQNSIQSLLREVK